MRLFDLAEQSKAAAVRQRSRDEVRDRAREFEELIKEHEELDSASKALSDRLAQVQEVRPIRYHRYRAAGSKWQIEHAQDGQDYVIQLFPLKPPPYDWPDILPLMIGAMDAIYPSSIHIEYRPPNDEYQIKFYTIRVKKVVGLPGWEKAVMTRTLESLARIDAWAIL